MPSLSLAGCLFCPQAQICGMTATFQDCATCDSMCLALGRDGCDRDYKNCLSYLPPDQPPGPTSPPDDDACVTSSTARGPQARVTLSGPLPRDASPGSCTLEFVDPVTQLQNQAGTDITSSHSMLAQYGTTVTGVAADSAARVVLRIRTKKVNDSVQVALLDESGGTGGTTQQLGTLSTVGGSENTLLLSVTSVNDTGEGGRTGPPMAFAVYRPPADYYRGAMDYGPPGFRIVKFQVTFPDNTKLTNPLKVWRPPIVLVHGLWDGDGMWVGFLPNLFRLGFPNVDVFNYNIQVQVTPQGTTPSYSSDILARANANESRVRLQRSRPYEEDHAGIGGFPHQQQRRSHAGGCGGA